MKHLIYPLTLILFIGTSCAIGQNRTNNISCQEYQAITFNGHTIEELNATNGDPEAVKQLMGSPTNVDKDVGSRSRSFTYGSNRISFNYEFDYVSGIRIKNNQWPVNIKGHTVKVGDSVAELKQAFGSDLVVVDSQYSSNKYVFFGCENTGSEGVNIKLDPDTNIIIEISYMVFT